MTLAGTLQPVLDALPTAFRILSLVVFGSFVALAALDFLCELRRTKPVGQRLAEWADEYPLYALGMLCVVGALLAHFFWQPPR